jgi:hypothetical protein
MHKGTHDITTYADIPAYNPPRWQPTVAETVQISAGDLHLEMWCDYDAKDGTLLCVEINGRRVSWQNVDAALKLLGCYDEHRHWSDELDDMTLNRLIAEQNIQADIDRQHEREGK